MPLLIVNTAPGKSNELAQPGAPIHLGLRSTDDAVVMGTFRASLGYSNIRNHGYLPETDPSLLADVSLHSVGFQEPQGAPVLVQLSEQNLVITKTAQDDLERCIYSVTREGDFSSALGYFRFKRKNWTPLRRPSWCPLEDMVGLFFGLRLGGAVCYAFLQDAAGTNGQLVPAAASGPLGLPLAPISFDWKTVTVDEEIELCIFFNSAGEEHLDPPNTPSIEIWAKTSAGAWKIGPFLQTALGVDPRDLISGVELLFGNAGTSGDVLELTDWVLFPDYRLAIRDGLTLPYHSIHVAPDVPLIFKASAGKSPVENYPGRWFFSPDGVQPGIGYSYQPGQGSVPQLFTLTKRLLGPNGESLPVSGYCTLEREAPLLEGREDGFMVETFVSSEAQVLDGDVFGSGISVDDGASIYRVVTLQDALRKNFGLQKHGPQSSFSGYIEDGESNDFTTLTQVRLTLDRPRNKALVTLDDVPFVDVPLSDTIFPGTEARRGLMRIGHVLDNRTRGTFGVASLLFVPNYRSWEAADGFDPTSAFRPFVRDVVGAGVTGVADGKLTITKPDFASINTKATFSRSEQVDELHGFFLEFQVSIPFYTDQNGTPVGRRTDSGVALRVYLGTKCLDLGFYDCGIYGRRLGILPGSGTIVDILDQTSLGQKFSARCDWFQDNIFRVLYRPFDKLEVWIGAATNEPAISLSWRGIVQGFDLPVDTTAPTIEFGHFADDTSSQSNWGFVRWGCGGGYDVTFAQSYSDGGQDFHFGGQVLYRVDFQDGRPGRPPE